MAEYVFHDHTGDHPADEMDWETELAGHGAGKSREGHKHLRVTLPDKRVVSRLNVPEGDGPRTYSRAERHGKKDA